MLYSGNGLLRRAVFEYHALGFDLVSLEHVGSATGYHEWSLSNPTSFGVEYYSARNGNEFLICGRTRRSKLVVELWKLPEVGGGWYSSHNDSGTAIGTPTPLTEITDVISGGVWIPPSDREAQQPARRKEVYLGSEITSVGGAAVDPEGRFVILIDAENKSIYRLPLDGSGVLTLVANSSSFPFLADLESTSIQILQDGIQGRVYAIGIRSFKGEGSVILADPENDGIFDPPFWLPHIDEYTAFPDPIWQNIRF